MPFPEEKCFIEKGQQLYAYTDGVTEAQNSEGEFFALERVVDLITGKQFAHSKDVVDLLVKELDEFTRDTEPFDDITMVSLCRE